MKVQSISLQYRRYYHLIRYMLKGVALNMTVKAKNERLSYTCSLVTQGVFKFYSLTMPSEVLSETCFVSTRDDDPIEGFQRNLDKKRAKEIADYIDNNIGSIPTAIILSAQKEADLFYSSKNRTIEFTCIPKGFLILDGQHRVYGFKLAKTSVRVPVIIYNNLSRRDETRLFIDINTKQRPVPTELLLDIKNLAEYENEIDEICREIFNMFNNQSDSSLLGLLSSTTKMSSKISRVTFNAAIKPIYDVFGERDIESLYLILNAYLKVISTALQRKSIKSITKPMLFRAIMQFFPAVARLANSNYSIDSFSTIIDPMATRIVPSRIQNAKTIKVIYDHFIECLNSGFYL